MYGILHILEWQDQTVMTHLKKIKQNNKTINIIITYAYRISYPQHK